MDKIDRLRGPFVYIQIANSITERIEQGVYTCRLPAERALAEEFGAAYQTVRHSMATLRDRGQVITRQGHGTFVAPAARPAGANYCEANPDSEDTDERSG